MVSTAIQLATSLALAIAAVVYLNAWRKCKDRHSDLLTHIPVVGLRAETFARARATFRSLWKTADWLAEGYAKFTKQNIPFVVTTWDRGPVVILPPDQAKILYRLPEDRLDVFMTLNKQLGAPYTIKDQVIVQEPFHRYMIPSQLTRELDAHTPAIAEEIAEACGDLWSAHQDWEECPLWQTCFRLVARITNRTLCGPPLCRDENYLRNLERQSVAVFGGAMLISITPKPFRWGVGRLVRWWSLFYTSKITGICAPHVQKRLDESMRLNLDTHKENDKPPDGLQLIINETMARAEPTQMTVELITERLLITNNVSIQNVAFTLRNLILNLATSDPALGYVDQLRVECRKAYSDAGNVWTLESVRGMKLLDSAVRESMRVSPFGSFAIARTVRPLVPCFHPHNTMKLTLYPTPQVIDPNGIVLRHAGSDVVIPCGTTLALPMEGVHFDEDVYSDASHFKPFRFASSGKARRDGVQDAKPSTTLDDHFLGLGASKNPCSGRFLGTHQVKLIMAFMLLNYDFEYRGEKPGFTNLLGMKVPATDVKLRVRKLDGGP
ncbi:cytochrome P450 [Xylariomycetidae sp. FL0641]|nr:cytochrome P450 [Xylariomycetidae sp. FL0641]